MADLPPTPPALTRELSHEELVALLGAWGHPRPEAWLAKLEPDADVWRALLADECDKLYNQAWCALERLREAEEGEEDLLVALDDFPTPIEQAVSLAPSLAGEHLDLLRQHRFERYEVFAREMGLDTARETAERIECLAFWEKNDEGMSRLRRTLFRLVREALEVR